MTESLWADPREFVSNPHLAAEILSSSSLSLPQISSYLDGIAERTDIDIANLRKLVDNTLVAMPEKWHREVRSIIASFFSERAISCWKPLLLDSVENAIHQLEKSKEPDLVSDFCTPLFMRFMPRVLGFNCATEESYSSITSLQRFTEPYLSLSTIKKLNLSVDPLILLCDTEYYDSEKDVPTSLANYLCQHRDQLPPELDVRYVALGFLVGSHSAAQSLANAIHGYLLQPAIEWRKLGQNEMSDQLLNDAISRYRTTKTLVRVQDKANPNAFARRKNKTSFVVDIEEVNTQLRINQLSKQPHMSFGTGRHKCPGRYISEMLFKEALPAISRAFPKMRIIPEQCSFVETPMMKAPITLRCELFPRTSRISTRMIGVTEKEDALHIIRTGSKYNVPHMEEHLTRIAESTGKELKTALQVARNALFFMEGERHKELRKAVLNVLSSTRTSAFSNMVSDQINELIDILREHNTVDLVAQFSNPLRQRVLSTVLGIETDYPEDLESSAKGFESILSPWLSLRNIDKAEQCFLNALNILKEPSYTSNPRSLLASLLSDPPSSCSVTDVKVATLVLYGASLNLSNTLTNCIYHLLVSHADLSMVGKQERLNSAELDKLLGLCSSARFIYRVSNTDSRIQDIDVHKGDSLRMCLDSLGREGNDNLAFGNGAHSCVGEGLSRLLVSLAIPRFFRNFPNARLASAQQKYIASSQIRALSILPVTLFG